MFMDSCIMLGPCFTSLFGFSRHVSSCCLVPCGLQTMLEKTEVAVHAMSDAPEVTCGLLYDVFDFPPDAPLVRALSWDVGQAFQITCYSCNASDVRPWSPGESPGCFPPKPLTPCAALPVVRLAHHNRDAGPSACMQAKSTRWSCLGVASVASMQLAHIFTRDHPRSVSQGIPGQVCTSVPMGIPIISGVAYDVSFDLHSAVLPVANLALWKVWLRPLPQGEPFDVAYRLRLPSSSLSAARVFQPKTCCGPSEPCRGMLDFP